MAITDNSRQSRDVAWGREALFSWNNPGRAITRDGQVIDTSGEIWRLPAVGVMVTINWHLVITAADVKDAMKAHIFHSIESQEAETAGTIFNFLKHIINQVGPLDSAADLTFKKLMAVLADLRVRDAAWKFGHARRWYGWCCNQEIPGFYLEIADRLFRLKIPPNRTGRAVMSRDPDDGPFSDEEHWLIRQAVKERRGPLLKRVCVMLLLELALRPIQAVALMASDLKIITSPSGKLYYTMEVPRAKQRSVGRSEKKRRRISQELGEQIEELIRINSTAYGRDGDGLPLLYPSPEDIVRERKIPAEGEALKEMTRAMFLYHVHRYAYVAGIISPQTGRILSMYPYRFRYTFGVRHTNQGTPPAVISELLDHTVLRSALPYVSSTSNSVDRLNRALGSNNQYTEVIGRFMGVIVKREGDDFGPSVIRGTTPTLKDLGGIGKCGADYLCRLMPPLSCYTCPKFQAWADAPHGEMKEELESYAGKLAMSTGNSSDRIPRQLDETIAAIKSLLLRIKKWREERGVS
jgi:hypothetical protein